MLGDCICPGLALAQAIGRWGNFFNMEAYGLPITEPALQFFPIAVNIPSDGGWHMATFFYESVWDAGVFLVLWLTRRKHHRDGDGLLWYLLLYGSGRLLIEGLRMDSLMSPGGGLRVSQLLSLLLCLAVCLVLIGRGFRNADRSAKGVSCLALAVMLALGGLLLFGELSIGLRELCGAGYALTGCLTAFRWRKGVPA